MCFFASARHRKNVTSGNPGWFSRWCRDWFLFSWFRSVWNWDIHPPKNKRLEPEKRQLEKETHLQNSILGGFQPLGGVELNN